MTLLALLFAFKIAVTLIGVALPCLLASPEQIRAWTGLRAEAVVLRLYGAAMSALLVGYGFGLYDALNGWIPTGILLMGIVSNGSAASMLSTEDGMLARAAWLFGAIALAFAVCLIQPEWALTRLW